MYPQIFLWKILLKIQVILQNKIEKDRLKSASSHLISDWLIIGCISLSYNFPTFLHPLQLLERTVAFFPGPFLGCLAKEFSESRFGLMMTSQTIVRIEVLF